MLNMYAVERGDYPAVAVTPDRWHTDGFWPYTVARMARSMGADGVQAIKISLGLAMILLVAGSVSWGIGLGGLWGGILLAVLMAFSPLLLSSMYAEGELAGIWALAGFMWAGWALQDSRRRSLLVGALAMIIIWNARPGMGLWASAALALLAMLQRRPAALIGVLAGAVTGFVLTQPWTRPLSVFTGPGIHLAQLLEPGWLWEVSSIDRSTAINFSLALPLALLLVGMWTIREAKETTWRPYALVGVLLALLSLQSVNAHLPSVLQSINPAGLLLLTLPLLAAAATAAWARSDLHVPLWSALLLLVMLNASPALSPRFERYDIPEQAVAQFGAQSLMLLSAQPAAPPQPGTAWSVDLSWVAWEPVDFDYNLFVHILDAQGNKIAQFDGQPQQGKRPMTGWQPGEVIADRIQIAIPADAPTPRRVLLGVYNWNDGRRLAAGEQDAIVIWEAQP